MEGEKGLKFYYYNSIGSGSLWAIGSKEVLFTITYQAFDLLSDVCVYPMFSVFLLCVCIFIVSLSIQPHANTKLR